MPRHTNTFSPPFAHAAAHQAKPLRPSYGDAGAAPLDDDAADVDRPCRRV